MEAITGVFKTRTDAERAMKDAHARVSQPIKSLF